MMRKVLLYVLLIYFTAYAVADNVSLARQYAKEGEYLKAAVLFEQCARGAAKDINYFQNLHDASECCYMLDDYRHVYSLCTEYESSLHAARNLDDEEMDICEQRGCKMWGTYHYGRTSSDTSDISYWDAEKAYMKAVDLVDATDSDFNDALYKDIAQLYYKWKRYDDALHYLGLVTPSSVVTGNKAMCLARMCDFEGALSMMEASLSELKGADRYEALRRKGKILMMQHDAYGTDNISDASDCYGQYVGYQISTIAKRMKGMSELQREQYWLGMHDFLTDCCRLGNHAPGLIYDLLLFSKGYLLEYSINGDKTRQTTWQQVQKALQDNEAAVEFLQYHSRDDHKRVGALVLTKGMNQPCFVDIASVDSIEDNSSIHLKNQLSGIVWNDALCKILNHVEKIYFAPDGPLHKCPIEYMHPDTSVTCIRLSSTRILAQPRKPIDTSSILLCGGIDYSSPQEPSADGNDERSYQNLKNMSLSIYSLPGTKQEIDSILHSRNNNTDFLLEGRMAGDSQFRVYARQYPCVHVATHGYYVNSIHEGSDLKPRCSDESMSESGLIFAGARYALMDTAHVAGFSDGLLSAKEISKLNLSKTDLVVLSACQSAQGRVTADGIYGLQRALKQAGVKAIIASLWDVDDKATAMLMSRFYENLNTGMDVHSSFMQARRQLMEEKVRRFSASSLSTRETEHYKCPVYADAFIMIDIL